MDLTISLLCYLLMHGYPRALTHQSFNFYVRDIMEIKGSEQRAHAQAEVLRNALEEHGLELRVKAAKEAEAACKQRLAAAEAEIAELKSEVDASDRSFFWICWHILTWLWLNLKLK